MQDVMVAPVLVLNDGTTLNLAPPSENKRWNESNLTKGKRKNENKYTSHELRALHVQTGDKDGVIKAIDKSTYLPNARSIARDINNSKNETPCFPRGTEQYDEYTVKLLLHPFPVGSKEWREQADKIADAKPHGPNLSTICRMFRGHWHFLPYQDEERVPPTPPSPPDVSPALISGVSMCGGIDAHDKENICNNECCRVRQEIPATHVCDSAPMPNRPPPILTSKLSQPTDENSPRNVFDFPSEPNTVTPRDCIDGPCHIVEGIVLTESGHIRPDVVKELLTSIGGRKSEMQELELSKNEEELKAALNNRISDKGSRRLAAAKLLRPNCNIINADNTEEMKLQVTNKIIHASATNLDVKDLEVTMRAISGGDLDRAAKALTQYINKESNNDLRERVRNGLKLDEGSADINTLQWVVDGIKKSITHHTNSDGGTRTNSEETFVKNVVVSCLFDIVDEAHDIPNKTLSKIIGATRDQIKLGRAKAQEIIDNGDGITPYSRKVRYDFIQAKAETYVWAFLQDDNIDATRFDSNQYHVKVIDPTTDKEIKQHKRVWIIVNKRAQHRKFLDSQHFADFQRDNGDATMGYHVWRNVFEKVGAKWVTNPLPISCVDEKTSALEHLMRALLSVLKRKNVKEALDNWILSGTGLNYKELVKTLQQAGSYNMIESILCAKIDYTLLHYDKSRPCPKGNRFECTHGSGVIDESGSGNVKCPCCGVKSRLSILDQLISLPESEDMVKVMVWKDGLRAGTDKNGKQNTQREIMSDTMTVKQLVSSFKKQVDICIPHVAEIRWCSMMMKLDRARLQPDEMIINTDYAASMCLKGSETTNSSVDAHAVNDNFVCVYKPRTVSVKHSKTTENGIEIETNEDVRIFTVDVHHFFAESISKGKKTDHAMHNVCLDKLIKHYQEIIPGLKKITVWTDNAPAQYRCRQNFLKVASVLERHPGIEIVHRLAITANFKGIHDAVGKDPAQLVFCKELENERSENAWGVFKTCHRHLDKTEDDTRWKGYEATGDARLKHKKVYGMDTWRSWFVAETDEEFQLCSTEYPGRILLCDRLFVLDTYRRTPISGTTSLHEIRSIATDAPTEHPLVWPVHVYRLSCNCHHCFINPHNNRCPITKWRRPRLEHMRVAQPRPDQSESIVGEAVAYAIGSDKDMKSKGTCKMPKGIYFGKVVKFDSSINMWTVKYEDERLHDDVFSYDELCLCLMRYRSNKKRSADKMMQDATGATTQAPADIGASSDQANPLKKARVTLSDEDLKKEYRDCLRSVLDTLQRHKDDVSKLKKKSVVFSSTVVITNFTGTNL